MWCFMRYNSENKKAFSYPNLPSVLQFIPHSQQVLDALLQDIFKDSPDYDFDNVSDYGLQL